MKNKDFFWGIITIGGGLLLFYLILQQLDPHVGNIFVSEKKIISP